MRVLFGDFIPSSRMYIELRSSLKKLYGFIEVKVGEKQAIGFHADELRALSLPSY